MDSIRTIDSNESNVSSYLLQSGNSRSRYTSEGSQRSVTPAEGIIRQEWYYTLSSTLLEYWENIRELFAGLWCAFLGGKLEAILRCVCLPCYVLTRALNGRRQYFRPQTGIVYLYVYLCAAVVLNLAVALKNIRTSSSTVEDIQKWFVILSVFVAIILMLYLFLYVYKTVKFPRSRGILLRVFYEGGTYVFGFSSFGFSICVLLDYISCGQVLYAVLTVMKATFTVLQILFLHYFYEARIPEDSPYIEIIMAHLLGTNLGLWFWTLCSEEADESLKDCTHYPIHLGHSEQYFSPLFVEYLLLAASLFYQIWKKLSPRDTVSSLPQRHCCTCYCNVIDSNTLENSQSERRNSNNRRRSISDETNSASGLGLFIGGCFAVLFIVLVLMSKEIGSNDQSYHIAYAVGIFILYLTQVCACYAIQLSLQSHERNPERFSLDHEDTLLYISLVGILLWECFHAYSLILSGLTNHVHGSGVLDIAKDALAIVQHLFQATTLVNLRRHQRTQGQHSADTVWICECVFFLLVTNLILWVQDSFFFEVDITTPGERYVEIQHDLEPIGYVVHPLSIFFRFHSSVCCIIAWSIFRTET